MRYLSIAGAAAVSAVAFTQIAAAADMPVKAPVAPVPAPIYGWTGFYVGVHAGWGWSSSTVAVTPSPAFVSASGYETNSFDQNSDGFIGGGQIGYNWQFAPNWVIGIEGDISGTGIRETTIAPITIGGIPLGGDYTHTTKRDITWLASVRGRLGYTANRWLIYVTGGGAWGRVEGTAGPNIPSILAPVTFSDTVLDGSPAAALSMPSPTIGRRGWNISTTILTTRVLPMPTPVTLLFSGPRLGTTGSMSSGRL